MDPIDEAEAILAGLRDVPPQHATEATVGAYRRALELLADAPGSRPWIEAQAGLASHLLESPHGDRAENVEGANAAYRELLANVDPDKDPDAFLLGTSGLANALVTDPAAGQENLEAALTLYEMLIELYRAQGLTDALTTTLVMAATALERMPAGDLDQNLERAIGLLEEAVRLVAGAGDPPVAIRGRARHNLAVLYAKRRTGLRSQNVDRAIRTLQAALDDRTAELDPVGRARTLRALALIYPEWSGADSLDRANELAEAARDEADAIERVDVRAAARLSGWAYFERQQSALNVDLDSLYQLDPADRLRHLEAIIANHRKALDVLPRDSMALRWADWMGGLGRLLGRYPSLGNWDHTDEADKTFEEAMAAFDPREYLVLARQILERWGEACHEIGHFESSLNAYADALMASDALVAAAADPRHRSAEISQSRGYALFAAYAAARLGNAEDAVAIAERGRMRLNADLVDARRALATAGERRDALLAALDEVRSLENDLARLDESDPEREQERVGAKLADFLKVDPSVLPMRRIDPGVDDENPVAAERERVTTALGQARARLSELIEADRPAGGPAARDAREAIEIARASSSAIVYLMATVHGGAAVAALPDGSCDVLLLEALTSDVSRGLLYGAGDVPGFANAALFGELDDLPASLEAIVAILGPIAMAPLAAWLRGKGVERAVLIPLGSLGVLPLHVAADDSVVFSYAPSARALSPVESRVASDAAANRSGLLILADPERDDEPALPFSIAEGRTIVTAPPPNQASILVRGEVTTARVEALAGSAQDIHFGCHGTFRPSDPLESELLLAGEDRLTLADVFADRVDLTAARVVTLLACQSGNAEFRQTPDESLGFPSALLLGGVRGVVSTMWTVDDAAAALFSVRLYELLYREGLSPAEAVARARSWLRDASGSELHDRLSGLRSRLEPGDEADEALGTLLEHPAFASDGAPYAAPEFWGPFIFTGLGGTPAAIAMSAAGARETAA